MATVVRMPSVLAGATEAAIAHWLVSPGDTVAVGTPIAEIETEKALVEYAAEEAGVVGRLVLGEGDSGEIGDPIAVLVAAGETDADIDAALGAAGRRDGGGRTGRRGGRTGSPRHPRRRASGDRAGAGAPGRTGIRSRGRRADLRQPARAQAGRASGASTSRAWPAPGRTGGSSGATWSGSSPRGAGRPRPLGRAGRPAVRAVRSGASGAAAAEAEHAPFGDARSARPAVAAGLPRPAGPSFRIRRCGARSRGG